MTTGMTLQDMLDLQDKIIWIEESTDFTIKMWEALVARTLSRTINKDPGISMVCWSSDGWVPRPEYRQFDVHNIRARSWNHHKKINRRKHHHR